MARTPPPPLDPFNEPAPQRGDRATFSERVDAFVMWLVTGVTQFAAVATNVFNNAVDAFTSATSAAQDASNASGSAVAAANSATNAANAATGLTASSTSSNDIGVGNKTFAVPAGKMFTPGVRVSAVNPGNSAQWMSGPVVSYSGTTLVVGVDATNSSGTVATWNISVTGQRGVAGSAGPAGGVAGGNLTGSLNRLRSPSVAVTSTPDIWAPAGNLVPLTGSGTITGFPNAPQAGAERTLLMSEANQTVTFQNGGGLIVFGGTQVARTNDEVDITAIGTNYFRVQVRRSNGLSSAQPAQTLTLLGSATISSPVANIDFLTLFSSDYDYYQIVLANLTQSAANNALVARVAKSGAVDAGTVYIRSGTTLTDSYLVGSSDSGGVKAYTGVLEVLGANSDKAALIRRTLGRRTDTNATLDELSAGLYTGTGPLTGFRLFFSAGANFTAGTVRVYGVRNVAGTV